MQACGRTPPRNWPTRSSVDFIPGSPRPARDAFTEVVKGQRRIADRVAVAERVQRLSEQLMPTLDRANRMMIRNLKAIKELRQGQVPAIAIGRAEQVTVTNRPPRRLRPLKSVAPRPDVTPAAITSGSDARSAVDGVVLVPSGKRRASQREWSVGRAIAANASQARQSTASPPFRVRPPEDRCATARSADHHPGQWPPLAESSRAPEGTPVPPRRHAAAHPSVGPASAHEGVPPGSLQSLGAPNTYAT